MNFGRSLQDGNSVLGEKKDQVAAVFLFSGCNTIGAGTLGLAYIGTLCGSWAVGVHESDHYTYDPDYYSSQKFGSHFLTLAHELGYTLGAGHSFFSVYLP